MGMDGGTIEMSVRQDDPMKDVERPTQGPTDRADKRT